MAIYKGVGRALAILLAVFVTATVAGPATTKSGSPAVFEPVDVAAATPYAGSDPLGSTYNLKVLSKLAGERGNAATALQASAKTAPITTSKFGKASDLTAAFEALKSYNKTHKGDFSKFDYAQFSLKYFGKVLLPPGPQGNRSSSGITTRGIVTASSSCGQTFCSSGRYRQGPLTHNGCGPENGLMNAIVPEYRFGGCCEYHDYCYATCKASKTRCEDDFYDCMTGVCAQLSFLKRGFCKTAAYGYWAAVSSFGCASYSSAQRKCTCEAAAPAPQPQPQPRPQPQPQPQPQPRPQPQPQPQPQPRPQPRPVPSPSPPPPRWVLHSNCARNQACSNGRCTSASTTAYWDGCNSGWVARSTFKAIDKKSSKCGTTACTTSHNCQDYGSYAEVQRESCGYEDGWYDDYGDYHYGDETFKALCCPIRTAFNCAQLLNCSLQG